MTSHKLTISIEILCYNLLVRNIDISEFKNSKTAFIMSGGVVKAAAWHQGVALALEELGFNFQSTKNGPKESHNISTYVGSSAGSLAAAYLSFGFRPLDIIEATMNPSKSKLKAISYKDMLSLKKPDLKNLKFSWGNQLEGFPTVVKAALSPFLKIPGLFTTLGLRDYLLETVIHEDNFENLPIDLFIVASQLDHSRKVIFSKYNYPNPRHDSTSVYYTGTCISDAIAASMAVPPFYSPYPIKNKLTNQTDYYIDGEIRETLSTHIGIDNRCDLIISSWTHTPYHFHDEVGSLVNYGIPAIAVQSIYLMIQKKIVASRARRKTAEDIVNTVNEYCLNHKIENKHRKKILSILENKLNFNSNVKFIDIYPSHDDYKFFFLNSFSLNRENNSYIVKAAYKRTIDVFKNAEWY